jgi:hypothetical protein
MLMEADSALSRLAYYNSRIFSFVGVGTWQGYFNSPDRSA